MAIETKNSTDWVLLKRVLGISKPFIHLFWYSIILAVLITPLSVLQPFVVQKIVDDNILTGNKAGMVNLGLVFMALLIGNVWMKYKFIYITADLGQSVIKRLRVKVFNHINHLKLRFFDQTPIGTSTTRTINDIEAIKNVFAEGVITIIADILTLIAVIVMMVYTSWRLTAIVFITMPLMIIASYIFKEKVKVSYQKVRTQVANMNAFLQERISGMKIVQLFNAEKKQMEMFEEINQKYTKANLDSVFYYAIFFPVVELLSALALALLIWLGAQGFIQDKVTFGALVAFPLYLNLMFRPLRFMADKFNTIQMGLVAADRVFKLLDNNDKIPNNGTIQSEKLKGDIRLENVSFAYDGENKVLDNINLEISAGKTLALVGSTGSGKSTIINLLTRFYDIEEGKIFVDGQNIKDYELFSYRKRLAIVLQDVFLFDGTIIENITLKDKSISEEAVIQAAKVIGADEFITNLPNGYDFKVSERGSNLSVGQRQLISFVRALVFDPDILILDEATSSIDTESEVLIQQAIEKLVNHRTSIIVAHRLSTIQHADIIIVMADGKIYESGTHEELLKKPNGKYRSLYEIQFSEALL